MAKSRESSVQDKIAEVTECSICVEIFTNPKILPCVHTFCLHCLENYGKDKKPGDQMVCPICRNEFIIPDGGLCNLPNNFLIGKMVEIGKLATAPANEAMCDLCPEGEELVAKMYCIDCEQILCERCSKSHKKTKFSQNHQVVELGSKLNAQNFNLRNSYCDHHPKELIKMYCYNDNVAICLICCVESHQSHRCVNVEKAAGDFTERLKEDLRKVTNRLPECENVKEKLDKYKKEFTEQISKTEESIRDIGTKLKTLIDEHTEILIQNLKSVREQNLKAVEITRQDVERFRVMIDSYSRYSEELLSRGSPVDICRAADQMHTRANELEKLPSNCSGDRFRCDAVAFQPSSFENI